MLTSSARPRRRRANHSPLYDARIATVMTALDAASEALQQLLELDPDGYVPPVPRPDDMAFVDVRAAWDDCRGAEWAIGIARSMLTSTVANCTVKEDPSRPVSWPGAGEFLLTLPQREVVGVLLAKLLNSRKPDVRERELIRASGVRVEHLADLFEGSEAWGKLIVGGRKPGRYRLAPLPECEADEEDAA